MGPAVKRPNLRLVGSGAARRLVEVADAGKVVEIGARSRADGRLGYGGSTIESGDEGCWPSPLPVRHNAEELATAGFDPSLQLIGGDPYGTSSWAGLVVPSAPTPDFRHRYLFLLAWLRLDANRRGRIVGLRTSVLLTAQVPSTVEGRTYTVEYELQNPFWKGPNGNVCFFLRRIPTPGQRLVFNLNDGPSINFRYANNPALLYESLAPYVPPGNGVPPGVDLSAGLGTFYDNRFGPYRNMYVNSTDIVVQGPCDIGLFCSVFQMTTSKPVPASTVVGLPPDDAFLRDNPTAQFGRVAGSIVWQEITAK